MAPIPKLVYTAHATILLAEWCVTAAVEHMCVKQWLIAYQAVLSNILFYDGATYPDGIFDDFLSIPHIESDLGTRNYSDLILTLPTNATGGYRYVIECPKGDA